MVLLHFQTSLQLVLSGAYMNMKTAIGTKLNQPNSFSLCTWVGGKNKKLHIGTINPDTGVTETQLHINHNDKDTVKLMTTINISTLYGNRPYTLASSFIPIETLCDLLDKKQEGYFTMTSNFDKNAAILKIQNIGTKVEDVRKLDLQPSVLRKIPHMNKTVNDVAVQLQATVSKLQITPDIGATQFVPMNTRTFLPMQDVATSYAILPALFSKITDNPVKLPWLMYDLFQTIHHTRLHPDTLEQMTDKELIANFGCPMIQNRCNCALTSPYSEDLTMDKLGRITQGTEEIGRTFSKLAIQAQITQGYTPGPENDSESSLSFDQIVDSLAESRNKIVQNICSDQKSAPRKTAAVILDDCENGAQGFIVQHQALKNVYLAANKDKSILLGQMLDTAKKYPHLFRKITKENHTAMASVLLRLGKLVETDVWNASMTVVTAKNRAMDVQDSESGNGLAGHGMCLAQIMDGDNIKYQSMEATTSMKVQPSKATLNRKQDLQVKMQDGTYKNMNIPDYVNVINQNLCAKCSISPFHVIQANIAEADEYMDDWKKSAFYVGAFYSGFTFHPNSLGCMPCSQASFGAPVVSLSNDTTTALPVQVTDPSEKVGFNDTLAELTTEVWPPAADAQDMDNVMSSWACIPPIPKQGLLLYSNYKDYVTSMISCAYDCPKEKKKAYGVFKKLAECFNTKQSASKNVKQSEDDGHRLFASTDYHSVFLNIVLKLPEDGKKMPASIMKNIDKTVEELKLDRLVKCPYKKAMMQKRMDLPTDQTIYKCEQGQGIVHSFQHTLA